MSFKNYFSKKSQNSAEKATKRKSTGFMSRPDPLPLEDVPEEIRHIRQTIYKSSSTNSFSSFISQVDTIPNSDGGLVKTFPDVISNSRALKHFVEFMQTQSAEALIKFCIDAQNFKSSATSVSKCLSELSKQKQLSEAQTSGQNSSQPSSIEKPIFPILNEEESVHQEDCPASPSSDSFDSGINLGQTELATDQNQNLTSEEQLILNQMKEALAIYQSYIAPESPYELDLSSDLRQKIVNGICSESGRVDPECFDEALQITTTKIISKYFPEYLNSKHNTKHKLEYLSHDGGRMVTILDILEDETLSSLFTEYLDQVENSTHRSMLDFWRCSSEFKASVLADLDNLQRDKSHEDRLNELQNEAKQIYGKFFSTNAISPLGFDQGIRHQIESNIRSSAESKLDPCSFDEATNLVIQAMHMKHLQKFINSILYKDYISHLRTSIEADIPVVGNFRRSSGSSTSSALYSLDAMHTPRQSFSRQTSKSTSHHFDFDTGCIWKRKTCRITNIGFVDSLGRYYRTYDPMPDSASTSRSTLSMGSNLTRAMKRIVSSSEPVDKEELAWEVTSMIISQVIARPKSDKKEEGFCQF